MKNALLLFATIFHIVWAWAQDYDIYQLGIADGLSQGMVTAMIQDTDGFIWVGTLSGLNRYDGNRFKVFTHNPNNPYSPSGNLVTGLLQDSKGRIWVGYQEGLDCYDPKTGRFYHLGNDYNIQNNKEEYASPVHQSANGDIWLEGKTIVAAVTVPDDFPATPQSRQRINYLVFDSICGLPSKSRFDFFITNIYPKQTGIQLPNNTCFKFNPAQKTWQQVMPGLQNQNPESAGTELVYDSFRQGYWGLFNQSLQLLKNGKIQQQLSLPDLNILCNRYHISSRHFYADKEGKLWLLAMHNGRHLYRITPTDVNGGNPPVAEALFKDEKKWAEFNMLLPDKYGNIWLGTVGYGLLQIVPKPRHFTHYLAGHSVNSIRPTPNSQSLYIHKGVKAFRFQMPNTIEPLYINALNKQYQAVSVLTTSNGTMVARFYEALYFN